MANQGQKDRIVQMLQMGHTYADIAKEVGCSKSNVSFHAKKIGYVPPIIEKSRRRYDWQEVQRYYNQMQSAKACIKYFGMTRKTWGKAVKAGRIIPTKYKMSLDEILIENSPYHPQQARRRIRQENILPYKCVICGILEWQGEIITLEIDHINGNKYDNRIENLRYLCPNCHSQTPTYRSKNKKEASPKMKQQRSISRRT